jgi:hypothetical protein
MTDEDTMPPPCAGDDVVARVVWERDGRGLRGEVIVRNVGDHACRLGGKPGVYPLAADGTAMPTRTAVTLELRGRGYVVVEPGQSARARVSWRNWCGAKPTDRAQVTWWDGSATARVEGPLSPDCDLRRPSNLTSSWFDLID